jgi:hypothetical protein
VFSTEEIAYIEGFIVGVFLWLSLCLTLSLWPLACDFIADDDELDDDVD